ncbi:MAG: MarC family protein [Terracidiphilus sp.]
MPVWKVFLIAFSVLLPLINPLGSALVFLGLVGDAPPKVLHSLARRIAINNIIFLGVFEVLGATILNFFGISLPIVQLSGGLVVAVMGWTVLNQRSAGVDSRNRQEETATNGEPDTRDLEDRAFYPLTFPITSGPGTLVALLTVTAHISEKNLTHNILAHLGVFLAVVVLSVLIYFCYAYAPKITKIIPPSTAHGILRVIAFILLCIGVQIAWNGLSALLVTVIKP